MTIETIMDLLEHEGYNFEEVELRGRHGRIATYKNGEFFTKSILNTEILSYKTDGYKSAILTLVLDVGFSGH